MLDALNTRSIDHQEGTILPGIIPHMDERGFIDLFSKNWQYDEEKDTYFLDEEYGHLAIFYFQILQDACFRLGEAPGCVFLEEKKEGFFRFGMRQDLYLVFTSKN